MLQLNYNKFRDVYKRQIVVYVREWDTHIGTANNAVRVI